MNITFLIGNGFDVGVGMNSRFSDFFPIYRALSLDKPETFQKFAMDINANEEKWSYFEKQLGEYTINFSKETTNILIEQIKDFEQAFIEYITNQEELLSYDDIETISKVFLNALLNYYRHNNLPVESSEAIERLYEQTVSTQHIYNFIVFNYTYIFENCIKCFDKKIVCKRKVGRDEITDKIGKIVHVHGYKDFYPIMGLNDEGQIANKELAKDKKIQRFLIKPQINKALRMKYDNESLDLIKKSSIICVYGMSLGETDKKWWAAILDRLNSNDGCQLVIFDYDDNYRPTSPYDWLDKEDSIMDKLFSYSTGNYNFEEMRTRIHIAVNKTIFKVDLMKKHNDMMDSVLAKLATTM